MRNPIADRVAKLAPSGIRRFFDMANDLPDVISLGVGEPDFDTPWAIRDAGITSLKQGRTFYTENAGLKELREEICRYVLRKYDVAYDYRKNVLVTVGGSEALDIALRTICNPGDEVIYLDPCFVSYVPCIVMADGVPVSILLSEENEFKLTAAELEAAITPKTKAVILSFPNNPTGAIMTREELMPLIEVIKKHDLLVISDEIYSELSYEEKHVSIASLPEMQERTILINGFSKAFAMTGWRLGYAMAPELIMKNMIKLHQFAIMSSPTTSQFAAIEGLRNCDRDVEMMVEQYNMRRNFMYQRLRKLEIPCFEPKGAFYIFPNIQEFGMTSEDFALRFLGEESVAIVPGSAFGEGGEGYLRVSYASSIEDLKEAMIRFEAFVTRLRDGVKKG